MIHLDPNQEYLNAFVSIADTSFSCDTYSLAAHSDQTVFVADPCVGQITHLDADGTILHQWGERGLTGETFNLLMDLSLAPDEQSLYVTDAGNNRVIQFSLDGQEMAAWDGDIFGVKKIKALDVAPDGALYLLDEATNEVVAFHNGENILRLPLPAQNIFAYDLVLDPNRQRIYVGSRDGILFLFDWGGNFIGFANVPFYATYLQVAIGPNGWLYLSTAESEIQIFNDTN